MSIYKRIIKPLFFRLSPERAHYFAMDLLQACTRVPGGKSLLRSMYSPRRKPSPVRIAGLEFAHPIGLAAGFDKDARWVDALECLGFSFVEIGTVTPLAQPGNEQPRLFRLPQDEALINRMGFNNGGAAAAAERLRRRKGRVIIGGNIGKNKITPNEEATLDYIKAFDALHHVVDYFVVNVSSPNTPGLRALQEKEPLQQLLQTLQAKNKSLQKPRPIFLKIAPDLTDEQLQDVVEIVLNTELTGVIATNTTIDRSTLRTAAQEVEAIGAGGLSGKPLTKRSTEVVRFLAQKAQGRFHIIGVGGIQTAADAREKLEAGASLVQVYTGFIYEGPSIVRNICEGL